MQDEEASPSNGNAEPGLRKPPTDMNDAPEIKRIRPLIERARKGETLTDDEMTDLYCDVPVLLDWADDYRESRQYWMERAEGAAGSTTPDTFCGFPPNADGTVHGDLPDDAAGAHHSDHLKAAGYDVHCVRLDEDADPETTPCWRPAPPRGDGWTLAWKAQDEDGWNAVWWRPTAQKRLEKLATMVLGLGLVSTGGKVVKDYARECLGITTVAVGGE
ncbi:hypothetical protein TSO5_03575 [Azospirillum sp. TSO5]|nr:hypothetical protein TSO5_03575 [Azospirillum sp. TSO5]